LQPTCKHKAYDQGLLLQDFHPLAITNLSRRNEIKSELLKIINAIFEYSKRLYQQIETVAILSGSANAIRQ